MTIASTVRQPSELNPNVSGELFEGHPNATLWIGRVAGMGTVEIPELYSAVGALRSKVYIDEMGFLDENRADSFGREYDNFDSRSIHLAVVQKMKRGDGARVTGAVRMIVKENADQVLPIEPEFTSLFTANPAEVPSVEVSRFISRNDDQMLQHAIGIALIRGMTYEVADRHIDTAYFEVERPLLGILKGIGLPLEELSKKPKEVVEPGGIRKLYPLKIKPSRIIDHVTTDENKRFVLRDFFKREAGNGGLGYYDDTLTGGVL